MIFTLKLLDGETITKSISSNIVVLGRSNRCDLTVPHESISREHCKFENVAGEIYITDLGSTNGVFLDGEKITPNKRIIYNTYLPLSMGIIQSIQIEFTETTHDAYKIKTNFEGIPLPNEVTSPTNNSNLEITQQLKKDRPKLPPKRAIHSKQLTKKSDAIRMFLASLIAIAIIVGGYFAYKEKKQEDASNSDIFETKDF